MNQKKFMAGILAGLICPALFSFSAHAQVYSQNIVGYYNAILFSGDNLIANQLADGDNSLNTLFAAGAPEGATFTKWDAATGQYLPVSTYDAGTGWTLNYSLGPGAGGLFNSPVVFTNTFVGTVWPGINGGTFVPPLVYGSGSLLLSCIVPIANATFYDVVGRNPLSGESVSIWNMLSQTTMTTTFDGSVWNNGDPLLAVGQSAFFNLSSSSLTATPEPSIYGLFGLGIVGFATVRNFRKQM